MGRRRCRWRVEGWRLKSRETKGVLKAQLRAPSSNRGKEKRRQERSRLRQHTQESALSAMRTRGMRWRLPANLSNHLKMRICEFYVPEDYINLKFKCKAYCVAGNKAEWLMNWLKFIFSFWIFVTSNFHGSKGWVGLGNVKASVSLTEEIPFAINYSKWGTSLYQALSLDRWFHSHELVLLLKRIQVWFPTPAWRSSQLPITPASEEPTPTTSTHV